jgi:hypothetical protein
VVAIDKLDQQFAIVHLVDVLTGESSLLATLVIRPLNVTRVKLVQENDPELKELMEKANCGDAFSFHFTTYVILKTNNGRIAVPNHVEVRREILDEAH